MVVYGSGNNLIICTATTLSDGTRSNHLQTIYLETDPKAVAVNPTNAFVAVALRRKVLLLRPVNEYMSKPQWTVATEITAENDHSDVNCVLWADLEDELVVGTDSSLALYHVFDKFGTVGTKKRWLKTLSNPVDAVSITKNASRILTHSLFTNLVSFWTRTTYDDDFSDFEVTYLRHPTGLWVSRFQWRSPKPAATAKIDGSMANIKNIRSYISDSDHSDVLYTVGNDLVLRVWASYEFSGHSHVRCWRELALNDAFATEEETAVDVIVLDNVLLQKTLVPLLQNGDLQFARYFQDKSVEDVDLVLVISNEGNVAAYSVLNINGNPPNAIKFERITHKTYKLDENCFPGILNNPVGENTREYILSEDFQVFLRPVIVPEVSGFLDPNSMSILIHDRLKNTVRYNAFTFEKILTKDDTKVGVTLLNKFQGHTKSIQKLVTSTSSNSNNILLSILNFPKHNYIWQPLLLNPQTKERMSITKRFQLDVTVGNPDSQGIWSAVLLNDIRPPKDNRRNHAAVVIEKGGFLSVWNCDGSTMDDQPAGLVQRTEILDENGDRVLLEPKSFLLCELLKENSSYAPSYCAIAIFETDSIKAWKISINSSIHVESLTIENLPLLSKINQIATMDSFRLVENLQISVIDDEGTLKVFAMRYIDNKVLWDEVTSIQTNIQKASKIHGASMIHKFAIVDESGCQLSLWDTKSGVLEYSETFPAEYGPVRDLDWTFVESDSSTTAILSVGFLRFVLLYTQLRYDYTNNVPTFAVLKKIDISDYTSHQIGDLVWIDHGYLVIGSGNQFFIDDKWVELGSANNNSLDSTIRQLMVGYTKESHQLRFDIGHLVKILNGPLPVYHPQFLIQCIFMHQFRLVKDILVKLFQTLRTNEPIEWDLKMDMRDEIFPRKQANSDDTEVFSHFNAMLLEMLVEKLAKVSLPLLTRHQQITLISVISIVQELDKYKKSVDENGIRFLIGFKLFQLSLRQKQLTMRDINWALHSDNKEMLITIVDAQYKHRLTWEKLKQTGMVYWVDRERLSSIIESCARNEFGDSKDPSGLISLLYLAIRKKKVLIGLWRTVSHTEQQKILKFLNHDFSDQRWRTAALKNAFILLGKHRYTDAAYFFLLADKVKDCCVTIANKMGDVELAFAISKVYSDQTEATLSVIENTFIPRALEKGDRWTSSWIFWEMGMKEVAVQALIQTPMDIFQANAERFSDLLSQYLKKLTLDPSSQSFLKDDPVLIILFHTLRQKELKYFKGSLLVDKAEEFSFIIKIATIYSRMGCDYLALLLIRNWTFIEEKVPEPEKKEDLNIFKEFKQPALQQPTMLEEPDMSAFNFGF